MATVGERHRREGETVPASKATRQRVIDRRREAEHGMSIEELKELEREAAAADRPHQALSQMTREDLYRLAQHLDVSGRSKMGKDELAHAIAETSKEERETEPAPSRRARRAGKRVRRVAREAPSGSFGQVVMLSLGLVVLYVALNNAQWFARALDAASTALAWLGDPDRAIPYATQEG